MESIPGTAEAGGAGGASSYQALKRLDQQWLKMRSQTRGKVQQFGFCGLLTCMTACSLFLSL